MHAKNPHACTRGKVALKKTHKPDVLSCTPRRAVLAVIIIKKMVIELAVRRSLPDKADPQMFVSSVSSAEL